MLAVPAKGNCGDCLPELTAAHRLAYQLQTQLLALVLVCGKVNAPVLHVLVLLQVDYHVYAMLSPECFNFIRVSGLSAAEEVGGNLMHVEPCSGTCAASALVSCLLQGVPKRTCNE